MEKDKIPKEYIQIQDIPKALKISGFHISYRGLRHYINIGLLPRPHKFAGHKEKYYHEGEVASRLFAIKYCRALFGMNHNQIKKTFPKVGHILDFLPVAFILAYSRFVRITKKEWQQGLLQPVWLDWGARIYLGAFIKTNAILLNKGGEFNFKKAYEIAEENFINEFTDVLKMLLKRRK